MFFCYSDQHSTTRYRSLSSASIIHVSFSQHYTG